MAKNDWIVAGLNNPEFTPYDFSTIAELNLNNTQMLSADEYMKSGFIQNHDMFKDESGNFSEDKFKQYHQKRLEDFREFQEQEFPKGPQLDMFDTNQTKDSRIKDIKFELGRHVNPDRQAIGIEGVRLWSDPTQTKSEIAQSQKIWDTAKQEFKDYSSNDKALSNGLFDWLEQVFSDPLVMAQWEEDGEHIDPITGMLQTHKKGDYKLNDKGTYYYETLNNRNPIGKEVLSTFDTLTVDGQGINKYDFFDSDDVKKSVAGVITKNVVSLLPLFTPVGLYYSSALVAKEFAKAMPMLYGWVTALSDAQEAPKWVNNAAAWGSKLSGGTSQYAKENTFSFENFGNLIADVALQWGQQKAIAQGINKLRGGQKYIDDAVKEAKALYDRKAKVLGHSEELWQVCQNKYLPAAEKMATQANQLGRDISMAYMAIVSNSDVYNDMRNKGLSNTEAAAISFGSSLGMFTLNKYTGLGEIFFDDATDNAVKLARKSIKAELGDAAQMFKKISQSKLPPKNKYLQMITEASKKARNVFDKFGDDLKYHTLNFAGKSLGEGLEEVSEELITDVSKSMYELAGHFGADTTLKDVGAWENALERYTMSFLGGAIGGGIFYGREALFDGKSYKQDKKNSEMATLIRNGHASELRAEVEKLRKEGKLGHTTLSSSKFEKDDSGNTVWLTTNNQADSQNDAIANAILEKITALETIINNNRVNLTEDQLFDNMVMSEKRYRRYQEIAPLTNYYQDFSNIVDKLLAAELDLDAASKTVDGTPNGALRTDAKLTQEQEEKRAENIKNLKEKVEELRQQKDEFLAGETSLDYTRKLNFLLDPALHSQFLSLDKAQVFKEKYGSRKYSELTPEEQMAFEFEWQELVQTTLKTKVDESWQAYKNIEKEISPYLSVLGENVPTYKTFMAETQQLLAKLTEAKSLYKDYAGRDYQFEDESDEDYQFRNKKRTFTTVVQDASGNSQEVVEEESDEDFNFRMIQRGQKIDEHNAKIDQMWVDALTDILSKVDFVVDPYSLRAILQEMPYRKRDVITNKIRSAFVSPEVRSLLKGLNEDLSNAEEIKQLVVNLAVDESEKKVKDNAKAYSDAIKQILSLNIANSTYDSAIPGDSETVVWDDDGGAMADLYLEDLTIRELLDKIDKKSEDLPFVVNPETGEYQDAAQIEILKNALNTISEYIDEDSLVLEVMQDADMSLKVIDSDEAKSYIEHTKQSVENTVEDILSNIKTNPIYEFASSLQSKVKNPVGELIKILSEKQGDRIPNLEELMMHIQSDFRNIEDPEAFVLDDTQMADLKKIHSYLNLIASFIYAASSNPNVNNPIGHNQVINSFAKDNKNLLLGEWEVLPEIESDYQTLYQQSISRYVNEIEYWIDLSEQHRANKVRKLIATDKAFSKALLEAATSTRFKVDLEDESFDLLQGYTESEEEPELNLFNAEQALHNNFQALLKKSKLSVYDFFQKTGLLEKLVPSITNIANQRVSQLTDTFTEADLTDYDLIQYFAQVFALNPSEFYSDLKTRVAKSDDKVPMASQEYSSRLAKALTKTEFREIMRYAHEKSGSKLPFLGNTIIIPGTAGAGKTSMILTSVNEEEEDAWVAGPTSEQANNLKNALHRKKAYTFKELLTKILGEDQLTAIEAELESIDPSTPYDGKYFTFGSVNGSPVIKLKKESITFNTSEKPKKIFLDEATHLSALEIQILNAFSEHVGALNYLAGDSNQAGYLHKKLGIENFQEDVIFAARSPKLTLSLRDNNLQKYNNQEAVRSVMETINSAVLKATKAEDLVGLWPDVEYTMSKFNFSVYNFDELNGDLITDDLSEDVLNKIKKGTVGFIGKSSSPYLKKLKEAGIEPKKVMTMDEMQGQEFDYVIIDQQWEKPLRSFTEMKKFVSNLYTSMTRATTASIFIDNGLSDIIGKNTVSTNKSKAPSVKEAAAELKKQKIELLSRFKIDLTKSDVKPEKKSKTPEPKPESTPTDATETPASKLEQEDLRPDEEDEDSSEHPTGNSFEDFIDPNEKSVDSHVTQSIERAVSEDQKKVSDTDVTNFDVNGEQVIETFTDITILGVKKGGTADIEVHRSSGKQIKTVPLWHVEHPQDAKAPLRNLQALYSDGTVFDTYESKIRAQKKLFDIKSALVFRHDWEDLPAEIKEVISKSDWNEGSFEIELRRPSDSDTKHLNAYKTKEERSLGEERVGMNFGEHGSIIVNLVFKVPVKTDSGIREAKFDIGMLPSVPHMESTVTEREKTLERRIEKASGEEKAKLQKQLANIIPTINTYKKLLETWVTQFVDGTFTPIPVNPNVISLNQTTWFDELQQTADQRGIQLGGKLDPVSGHRSKDNLMLRHPEMVFSPIYTYATDARVFEGLDPSIKGKAVVFVSSDSLLKPDELIHEYITQKYNPDISTARVRMLVLDNYGMTFSQFIDPEFIKLFQHGDSERKPFRQNFTGIRMFTSMWNWRASLLRFTDAVEAWRNKHDYTPGQVEALAEADQLVYRGQNPDELLSRHNLTKTDLENFNNFNNNDCLDIPIFRLGHSENGNGFYIKGNVDVRKSHVYNKDRVNLLAITYKKAKQFAVLLDRFLSSIEYSDKVGQTSLGVRLLNSDENPFDVRDIIDPGSPKHQRTLSGLLESQLGELKVVDSEGNALLYPEGMYWSMIPAMVSHVARAMIYFQHNPTELSSKTQFAHKTIGSDENKTVIYTQMDDLFADGYLGDSSDYSVSHLLDLMFHGTVEVDENGISAIHKKLTSGEQLFQLEDAYFKKGFFINPDLSRRPARNGEYDIFSVDDASGEVLFYKIETSPELFTVDTDVRTSGIAIHLERLFEKIKEEEKVKDETEKVASQEEIFKRKYPNLSQIISDANLTGQDFEYTLDPDNRTNITNWINQNYEAEVRSLIEQKDVSLLSAPFKVTIDSKGKVTYKTFGEYITEQNKLQNLEDVIFEHGILKTKDAIYTVNSDFTLTKKGSVVSSKSRYDHKIYDEVTVKEALLSLTSDESEELNGVNIVEMIEAYGGSLDDRKELNSIFLSLFKSSKSDDEIDEELQNLANDNLFYSGVLHPIIQEYFPDLDSYLKEC